MNGGRLRTIEHVFERVAARGDVHVPMSVLDVEYEKRIDGNTATLVDLKIRNWNYEPKHEQRYCSVR